MKLKDQNTILTNSFGFEFTRDPLRQVRMAKNGKVAHISFGWLVTITNKQTGVVEQFETSNGAAHIYEHLKARAVGVNAGRAMPWRKPEIGELVVVEPEVRRYAMDTNKVPQLGYGMGKQYVYSMEDPGKHGEQLLKLTHGAINLDARAMPPCAAHMLNNLYMEAMTFEWYSTEDEFAKEMCEDLTYSETREAIAAVKSIEEKVRRLVRGSDLKLELWAEEPDDEAVVAAYQKDWELWQQEQKRRPASPSRVKSDPAIYCEE